MTAYKNIHKNTYMMLC